MSLLQSRWSYKNICVVKRNAYYGMKCVWVPKGTIANSKGPKKIWVPKT